MVSELDRKKPIIDTTSSGRGSCTCSCVYEGGGSDSSEWPSGPGFLYPIINSTNCGSGYLPLGACPCVDPGECACDCQCIDDPMTTPGNVAQQGPGAYVNRDNPSSCTCEAWLQPENPDAPRDFIFLENVQMGLNFCPQGVVYDQFHGGLVGRNYYSWSVDPVFDYIRDCEGNQQFHADFYPQYWGQECVTAASWWCDSDWPSGDDCHCSCSNGQYASSLHDWGYGGGDCDSDAECGPHCQNWCSTFNPYTEMWACIWVGPQDLDGDGLIEGWAEMSPPGICPQEEHGCKHICESLPQWQSVLNSMSGNVFTMPNIDATYVGIGPGVSIPLGGPGIPFMVSACISGVGNIDTSTGGIIN